TFRSPISFGTAAPPLSVVTSDFNRDGYADLATANYGSNNVSVLLHTPAGRLGYGSGREFIPTMHVAEAASEKLSGKAAPLPVLNASALSVREGLAGPSASRMFSTPTRRIIAKSGQIETTNLQAIAFGLTACLNDRGVHQTVARCSIL